MCCLFGIYAYRGSLTAVQKRRLISSLATASEARGTDATGIAYNCDGHLAVYKRPWPAHLMLPPAGERPLRHGAYPHDHPGGREEKLQ